MLIKTLRLVTILLVALLLGLAFAHVLERPAKMLYDAAFYLTIQKTLYVAWGPPNIGVVNAQIKVREVENHYLKDYIEGKYPA